MEKEKMYKEEKKQKSTSWLDLSEDELTRLTDVSICMYKGQNDKK